MHYLAVIWGVLHTLGPWLVLSFIPSLIVGLSKFPQTAGVASLLKRVLGPLSVLEHADGVGTFKAPLLPCRPPTVQGVSLDLPRAGKESGRASLGALLAALALGITTLIVLAWGGCATVKPIATDFAQCSKANVVQAVGDISATVTAILESGASNWQAQLAGLGLTVGKLEVECAVQAVTAHLQATIPAHGEVDPHVLNAVVRGKAWLVEQGAK